LVVVLSLPQDYIALLQSPKPGSDVFKAMYASALEGQEEAARNPVVRYARGRPLLIWKRLLSNLSRDLDGALAYLN
jgi:hypothetical protein